MLCGGILGVVLITAGYLPPSASFASASSISGPNGQPWDFIIVKDPNYFKQQIEVGIY